jgi:cytochrome c556
MKTVSRKVWFGAAVCVGLLLVSTASAWYGGPWGRPYGSGAMTYERQNMMSDHGWAMRGLSEMFEGRRAFNREEAVRLARELEAGLGDQLIRNYAPGTWVAGSRTAPWTWRHFGAFKGYAVGAEQSAARLADALEKEPTTEEIQQEGVWMTSPPRRGIGRWHHLRDDRVSLDAIREYSQLNATCHSCHGLFRGGRW